MTLLSPPKKPFQQRLSELSTASARVDLFVKHIVSEGMQELFL
jgi:hypothetical protein